MCEDRVEELHGEEKVEVAAEELVVGGEALDAVADAEGRRVADELPRVLEHELGGLHRPCVELHCAVYGHYFGCAV